jgi:hypothetical protein
VPTRCVLVDFGNVIAFFDHRKAYRVDLVAAGRVLGLTGLVYAPGVDVQAATCY